MDVYCVKEKRFTPNVPGSETFAITKNGRRQLKVKCASCGITKTRFIRGVNPTPQGNPRGGGMPWFFDIKKGITLLKDALQPYSEEDAKARYYRYKREYAKYKSAGGTKSFHKWMRDKGLTKRPSFP